MMWQFVGFFSLEQRTIDSYLYFRACSFFFSMPWNIWERVNSSISWWKKSTNRETPIVVSYILFTTVWYLVQDYKKSNFSCNLIRVQYLSHLNFWAHLLNMFHAWTTWNLICSSTSTETERSLPDNELCA